MDSVSELYARRHLYLHDLGLRDNVIDKARNFSYTEGPVLILGESGVGKNLLAQGIHNERMQQRLLLDVDDIKDHKYFFYSIWEKEETLFRIIRDWLTDKNKRVAKKYSSESFLRFIDLINECMQDIFLGFSKGGCTFKNLDILPKKSLFYAQHLVAQLQQKDWLPQNIGTEFAYKLKKTLQNPKTILERIDLLWLNRLFLEACFYDNLHFSEIGIFCEIMVTGIPEGLFEAELFGTEKGAATGIEKREGLIALAENGTLFLDELGDISLYLQSKLLRVVEQRKYFSVGGRQEKCSNAFVICATNKSLEDLQNQAVFRQDLYYRLSFSIDILPFRHRSTRKKQEILKKFIDRYAKEIYKNPGIKTPHWIKKIDDKIEVHIPSKVYDYFGKYPWPGNIREIKFTIKSMLYSAIHQNIQFIHLPVLLQKHFLMAKTQKELPADISIKTTNWDSIKKTYISFLVASGFKQKDIAQELEISEKTVSNNDENNKKKFISISKLRTLHFQEVYDIFDKNMPNPEQLATEALGVKKETLLKYINRSSES